ncbi:MAG: four helix bundle protein [Chlorobiaceae bacterium]|nr:four helix bundle protein [Chlorobiaceae bacterium]
MGRINPEGGYRDLRSFRIATVIYDAAWRFCELYPDARSRMIDQMVQAARSCRQNIAQGSRASATSRKTELRLVNAARSSLEELLLDFEDFLRHRQLPQWAPDSPEAIGVRSAGRAEQSHQSDQPLFLQSDDIRYSLYARWLDHAEPSIRANTIICLIQQASFLLDRQIEALVRDLIEEGGYSERKRKINNPTDPIDRTSRTVGSPKCPKCGKPMSLRTARNGKSAGRQFWGCTGYPECKGIADV